MILIVALGIGLAINPATSKINPGLFRGVELLIRGIHSTLFK